KAGQLEKGSEETARETLNGLTTPKNLALMLGSLGVAATGATAARLVSALWAGVMGKQAIEDAPKIATEIGTEVGSENPDYAKIGKGLSQLGVDAAFTVAP